MKPFCPLTTYWYYLALLLAVIVVYITRNMMVKSKLLSMRHNLAMVGFVVLLVILTVPVVRF